jgi:FixJ family two-component response regulator
MNGSPREVFMGVASLVHVLDDEPSIRRGFERLLRAYGWEVRGYGSVAEFRANGGSGRPGCLLLDVRLPEMSGLDLLEHLHDSASPLAVVLISGYGDVPSTVRAMRYGAVDFLTKPVSEEKLVDAVTTAAARSAEQWRLLNEQTALRARLARLTPRESQVCALVAQGLLNKQIAGELGTSEKTIKVHRARVMQKLQVGSVPELVRLVDRTSSLGASAAKAFSG